MKSRAAAREGVLAQSGGTHREGGVTRFVRNLAITRSAYRALAGYLFHRYFRAVSAATDDQINEVFRIRYDVYCAELQFEDPGKFPDKREIDIRVGSCIPAGARAKQLHSLHGMFFGELRGEF